MCLKSWIYSPKFMLSYYFVEFLLPLQSFSRSSVVSLNEFQIFLLCNRLSVFYLFYQRYLMYTLYWCYWERPESTSQCILCYLQLYWQDVSSLACHNNWKTACMNEHLDKPFFHICLKFSICISLWCQLWWKLISFGKNIIFTYFFFFLIFQLLFFFLFYYYFCLFFSCFFTGFHLLFSLSSFLFSSFSFFSFFFSNFFFSFLATFLF